MPLQQEDKTLVLAETASRQTPCIEVPQLSALGWGEL